MRPLIKTLSWKPALATKPVSGDFIAGITVALVLIPQSLAYARIAGLPSHVGLFAAALPPLLAALFVSSPYLQTGPVALTSLLTFGALQGHAEPFSQEWIALAALLALIVGLTRMLMGLIRAGTVAYLMSSPVLTGFTSAAAVLIGASQIPTVLGAYPGASDDGGVLSDAWWSLSHPGDWNGVDLAFGAFTLALMVGGQRLSQKFPGVLVAVVGGVIINELVDTSAAVVGELPGGWLSMGFDFEWSEFTGLIVPGVVIALVGFAEAASIARTYAATDRQPWSPNKEMFSQGIANVASAVSGSMPVGGSFSRSALNRLSGARTAWSGAITGIVVLAALPLVPRLENLPMAVLGAIVIGAVVNLVQLPTLARIWRHSITQAVVATGTFVATLVLSPHVERGILVGIVLSIAGHLFREMQINYHTEIVDTTMRIEPRGVVWFGSTPRLEATLAKNLADHPEVEALIIDVGGVGRIDYTGAVAIKRVVVDAEAAGLDIRIDHMSNNAHRALATHLAGSAGVPPLDEPVGLSWPRVQRILTRKEKIGGG